MWTCTPSFQTASKACAALRLNGRNWLSISNAGASDTWLKEAESRMREAQNTDLFGSEHIGEQAALAMETQPENNPNSLQPLKTGLSSRYHRSAVCRLVGQTVAGGQNRHRHGNHIPRRDERRAGRHQHRVPSWRSGLHPRRPQPDRRARTA